MPPLKRGWALRSTAQRGPTLTASQREFVKQVFDLVGKKVKGAEAAEMMAKKFSSTSQDSPFYRGLRLTSRKLQYYLSTEAKKRRNTAAREVIDRGLLSLHRDVDLGEGGDVVQQEDEGLAEMREVPEDGEGRGQGQANGREGEEGGGARDDEQEDLPLPEPEAEESAGIEIADEACGAWREPEGFGGVGKPVENVNLWCVVREAWEDDKGFVLFELASEGGRDLEADDGVMDFSLMENPVMGRKWVHEACLMHVKQPKAPAVALKDKTFGKGIALKLGREGERRFAPRLGRAGQMQQIVPGTLSA